MWFYNALPPIVKIHRLETIFDLVVIETQIPWSKCRHKAIINVRPNVILYSDMEGSGGVTVVVSEVDDTETNVTGLTPGVLYTFSVTTENDVSSQDNNINVRTVTTTATTEEGGLFGSQMYTL